MGRLVAGERPLSIAAWGSDLLLGARGLARVRAQFALRRAQLVLCDADNLAAAALAAGAREGTVRALPWGVDRARFHAREARTSGLILSVRMHEPVYDMPTVIQAAARVLDELPHATFVAAGDGSQRAALEALAARMLPAGRWRFVGRVNPDEMAEWLARAEVVVSASLSDSTSQSLLEAMASGTVPVVSDIAGNREWVADGDGARLFAPGDAAGCARAVLAALRDPAWCETARARNAGVVEARGDWHVNLGRIEAWFAALAAGRPLPAWPEGTRA
jgi:glycosyltransferase involved in cell wall biosynthesis